MDDFRLILAGVIAVVGAVGFGLVGYYREEIISWISRKLK